MAIHSLEFLLLFLPLSVLSFWSANYLVNYSIAKVALLVFSGIFLYLVDERSLYVLICVILLNYTLYTAKGRRFSYLGSYVLLVISIVLNLAILIYYKYWNASVSELTESSKSILQIEDWVIPVGISFYIFQMISFQIDVHKSKRTLTVHFLDFSTYASFFPQLVNGPIVKISRFYSQLQKSRLKSQFVYAGVILVVLGITKKVLIADSIEMILGEHIGHFYPEKRLLNWDVSLALVFGLTSQVYFDFSAYSDMAIGMGYLFGYSLPVNFRSPYRKKSLIEAWRVWNITLTKFIRDYIYNNLYRFKFGWKIKIFICFLFFALWHGWAEAFFMFAMIHAVAVIALFYLRGSLFQLKQLESFQPVFEKAFTILVLLISVPLFRIIDVDFYYYLMESFFYNFDYKVTYIKWWQTAFCVASFFSCLVLPNSIELLHSKNKTLKRWSPILLSFLLFVCLFFVDRTKSYLYFAF